MQERNRPSRPLPEGEAVLKRLELMREAVGGVHTSGTMSRWEQYLPGPDASLSREETKMDNYRHSLEKRLERLFREEKQLMKERHYGDQLASKQKATRESGASRVENRQTKLGSSGSIDNMERKLRVLEEKYRARAQTELVQAKPDRPSKEKSTILIESSAEKQVTNPSLPRPGLCSQPAHESYLQAEVSSLKQAISQLRLSNEQLMKKLAQREERKKHKKRTKELLLAILHKLEFINAQIVAVNRRGLTREGAREGGKEGALVRQFEGLREQYRVLEEERRKVEARQKELSLQMEQLNPS